jgi:hypothetical protein
MRYFKNGKIYDESEIKKLVYPSSLPKNFKPVHIESKGFLPISEIKKPSCTDLQIVQDDGVKLIGGVATQMWSIVDKFETQEEIDTYFAEVKKQKAIAMAQDEKDKIARISYQAKEKLKELDFKSIRAIREYILSKNDAPQYLKNYEIEAAVERKKVKNDAK